MTSRAYALARAALVRALTAYSGITSDDGAADGTTLVDSTLIGRNDFISEKTILIGSGDAKDEDKGATSFDNTDGKITLQGTGFSAQIKAGTVYRVLNISTVEIDVANMDAKIGTNTDAAGTTTVFARLRQIVDTYLADGTIGLAALKTLIDAVETKLDSAIGATGIFYEQADTAVDITAVNTGETNVFNLSAASTRYIVRSLRLKCADPGANTVTVRLYELVNDVLTEVDSFDIDSTNFGTAHSLMDMFGLSQLAGDELKVTVRASAGGPYAVTGQYSHAKTNV